MPKDKMPVWVDEEAHGILKAYAKTQKQSMVSFASELILNRIDSLDPSSGLSGGGAPAATTPVAEATPAAPASEAPEAAAVAAVAPVATTPQPPAPRKSGTTTAKKRPAAKQTSRRPRKQPVPTDDGTVRFLGGVWLV